MNTIQTMPEPPEEQGELPVIEPIGGNVAAAGPPVPAPPADANSAQPPNGRKSRLAILSTRALLVLGGICYWKRVQLQQVNPYVPVVIPSLIAVFQIRFEDLRCEYAPPMVAVFGEFLTGGLVR